MIVVKKVCVIFALSYGIFVVGSENATSAPNRQCKSAADEYCEAFDSAKDFTVDEILLMELAKKYVKNPSCETIGADTQHGRRWYVLKSPDQKKRRFGRGSSGPGEGQLVAKL